MLHAIQFTDYLLFESFEVLFSLGCWQRSLLRPNYIEFKLYLPKFCYRIGKVKNNNHLSPVTTEVGTELGNFEFENSEIENLQFENFEFVDFTLENSEFENL